MERYCYLKDDCSLSEGKKDNGLWELNYRRLVESALKNKKKQDKEKQDEARQVEEIIFNMFNETQIPYQEVYQSDLNPKFRTLYKELVYGVLKSTECELDVVNEVYLMAVRARKEKEKELLFFSEEDDLNGKMKDNIKNIKRGPGKQNIIFHIAEDLGTGKNQKIDAFGSEIIRFYLWSKDFRNLFVKTKKVYDKYSYNEILGVLDSGVDEKILTRKPETSIILEKILSLTSVQCMNSFIGDLLNEVNVINVKKEEAEESEKENTINIDNAKKKEAVELEIENTINIDNAKKEEAVELGIENTIIDMVKKLWEIPGEYSRTLMIQLIYTELKDSRKSLGNKENEQRAIELYIKLLEEVKKDFTLYYKQLVKSMWEEYRKEYSAKGVAELLKEKREQLFECDAALTLLASNREKWHGDKTNELKKRIEKNDSKKIEEFWNVEDKKWKITPFYIEQNYVFKPTFKFAADERFLNLIQRVVIQQNIKRYSK